MAFSKICSAFESHLKFLARSFHTENYLKVKVGYIIGFSMKRLRCTLFSFYFKQNKLWKKISVDCGFGLFCTIFDDFEALLCISKAFTLWESRALTTRPLLPMAPKGAKGGEWC